MSRVLLIRHAAFAGVGRILAGRTRTVQLSTDGHAQARRLADALAVVRIAAVHSSPQPRALQTAAALAQPHGLEPVPNHAFDEIDFGDWTGRDIASLEGDAVWHAFNTTRTVTRIPGGELMLDVQARAWAGLLALQQRHAADVVAVVSHADVIRTMLAHALGMPLDAMLRLHVEPASVSEIRLGAGPPHVQFINRVSAGQLLPEVR